MRMMIKLGCRSIRPNFVLGTFFVFIRFTPLLQPDPRIEDAGNDVAENITDDRHDRNHEDNALGQREVLLLNAL